MYKMIADDHARATIMCENMEEIPDNQLKRTLRHEASGKRANRRIACDHLTTDERLINVLFIS